MRALDDDQIRAVYAAFSERREVSADFMHPDVEWHNDPKWPGASVHRGIDAVRRDLARQREAWGEARYEPVDILRAGDRIVVLIDMIVTGRSSGVPMHVEGAHILTLRDGKVAKVQAFTDRERARAAAGIEH